VQTPRSTGVAVLSPARNPHTLRRTHPKECTLAAKELRRLADAQRHGRRYPPGHPSGCGYCGGR